MEWKGDFLGFTFAGIHSSTLNITRTSDGDRFDEEVIPEIRDITVEVPGKDGDYYFGSTYGPRTFEVSIAYDNMTEEQLKALRKLYGRKQIGELIFDERPYKKYLAKIESPISLSYICFDEPNYTWEPIQTGYNEYVKGIGGRDFERKVYDGTTRRIYKGEGKITFVCYFPFAKSAFKVLEGTDADSDWAVSSGIMTAAAYTNIDKYNSANNTINVYNAGDVPTGFRLYLPSGAASHELTLSYSINGSVIAQLTIDEMTLKGNDNGFLIDTDSGLIVGVLSFSLDQNGNAAYTTSGNLYNEYVKSGYFFKLQPNLASDTATLQITGGVEGIQIFYDYLYF